MDPMIDSYLAEFARQEKAQGSALPSWLARRKKDSLQEFARQGGKPMGLDFLETERFVLPAPAGPQALTEEVLNESFLAGSQACRGMFVNGRLSEAHCTASLLPSGAFVKSLGAALREHPDLLQQHLGSCVRADAPSLEALNMAFWQDGVFVYLPRGAVLAQPIHILYVSLRNGQAVMSHPRNLVVAEEGSQATLIETYLGFGEGRYFTNAVTEVLLGENASVDHYRLQKELHGAVHIGAVQARQKRDSRFSTHSMSVGGGLVRNDVNVLLEGEGARCTLNGLYVATGHQHVDHHTRIDHARPRASSTEYYKGILDGKSRAVFDGTIVVRPDAQKSDARQTNKNLLLSDDALVDTIPRLEIFADDVKCSHGATVGALDEDAIFYLQSRGLGRSEARNLLTYAFANEMVEPIRVEKLRTYLSCYLLTHFSDGHLRPEP
jgi:Fe-S cluster assembly protein SufD